jgi:hypothetical protein
MIVRRMAVLEPLTCAAPNYLERYGVPNDPDALGGQRKVGLRSLTTGRLRPMEFMIGEALRTVPLPVIMSVTGPESYRAMPALWS